MPVSLRGLRDARLRRKALALTRQDPSRRLLDAFEELVFHPGMSGNTDVHYQDREIRGAVCCTVSEAMLMHHVARLSQPGYALEIGSYIGWSSAHLASGLTRCALTCVDPFLETGGPGAGQASAAEAAYRRFQQNMARAGVADKVRLTRGKSPDVIPAVSEGISWDFVFVDGWHLQGQPVRDVAGVLPFVSAGAVMLLHDLWIADVRDALLYLVGRGWSYRIFDTANYLTVLWRGTAPPWLDELVGIAEQPGFVLESARARRFVFGLVEESIEAARTVCDGFAGA